MEGAPSAGLEAMICPKHGSVLPRALLPTKHLVKALDPVVPKRVELDRQTVSERRGSLTERRWEGAVMAPLAEAKRLASLSRRRRGDLP